MGTRLPERRMKAGVRDGSDTRQLVERRVREGQRRCRPACFLGGVGTVLALALMLCLRPAHGLAITERLLTFGHRDVHAAVSSSGKDFSGTSLEGADYSGKKLAGMQFHGTRAAGANFGKA